MMEKVKMTMGVSLVLNEISEKLLFAVKDIDGKKMVVDRELPFRLRYRLNRNYEVLSKDAKYFDMQRMLLMAKYGNPTEDGKNVVIPEDKQEEYREKIGDLIDSVVEHTIMTLEPDDLVLINDTDITVSPDAMAVFIGYMTNDPAFTEEITTEVKLVKQDKIDEEKPGEEVKTEAVDVPTDSVTKESPVVETLAEETKVKKTTKSNGKSKGTRTKKSTKVKEENKND